MVFIDESTPVLGSMRKLVTATFDTVAPFSAYTNFGGKSAAGPEPVPPLLPGLVIPVLGPEVVGVVPPVFDELLDPPPHPDKAKTRASMNVSTTVRRVRT